MATPIEQVTREIVRSEKERRHFLADLASSTRAQLARFAAARREVGAVQHARLARERTELAVAGRTRLHRLGSQRRTAAPAARAHAAGERAALALSSRTLLSGLAAQRHARVRQAWRQLLNAERARRRSARAWSQQLAAGSAQRRAGVGASLRRLHTERAEAERTWATNASRVRPGVRRAAHRPRAAAPQPAARRDPGATVAARPRPPAAATTRAAAPAPPAPAQPPRSAIGGRPAADPALVERVLAHLSGQKEGVQLADAAERFEVAPIRMAGLLERLVESGRVVKRDRRYLARKG
jgi:hypothetical protein